MDFDEYEYLEKMVETPEHEKMKENANGGDGGVKPEEKQHSRSAKDRSHKKKDNDYDDSHRSKRQKSVDESHDPNQGKERGSSSHGSRSRDGERERQRTDREHKNRDRDLERSRDKEERNGKHRGRDQDRSRRDHGHDRERDKEREREQSRRSRSQSERHQSDRDEDRERSQDKEFREREREREFRERDRESRRPKEKKEKKEEVSVPDADPERDQRTVFAYQLSLKASERDVYDFFSRAGKVRDVRLIMDRISRRSKGVGYIEFYDVMSVPMAIALCGQPLLGQPIMVKPSEAEKNLVQSTASAAGGSGGQFGPYSGGARRLYVGNLHHNITEDQLRLVFEAFGTVELVQLPLDETGHCKGYGLVQFTRLEDAKNALTMNGEVQIAGRPIEVSTVTNQVGMLDVGANAGDLDDEEGSGLPLNSHSRALLMQKLDRSGTASSIPGLAGTPVMSSPVPTAAILGAIPGVSHLVPPTLPASVPALSGLTAAGFQLPAINVPTINTIGDPSECLLLKNMFDPKLEMEPDFDLDIREDVREECSRFGNLKHIHVDKETDGYVYLRFENTQSAVSAQRNLHGRWFAGKMITATFMVPQTYESKFPDTNT